MKNNKQRKRQKELYDFDKNWIHIYFLRFKCNLFTSFYNIGYPCHCGQIGGVYVHLSTIAMWTFFRRYKRFFWVLGILSAAIVLLFFRALQPIPVLPIYQPAMVDPVLVDESIQYVKKYHRIDDFSLTNQNKENITHEDYDDHIYVADFFFTTCPSICPIMTENMVYLQSLLNDLPEIKLLSFSVTPDIDTPEVLKTYAQQKGVNDSQWNLLTGDKKEIYNLARRSYLVVQEDGNGDEHDMIHTENFVLIDRQRRIRGYYDGTQREAMDQIRADIDILLQEK